MKFIRIWLAAILLLVGFNVQAAQVENLYTVEIAVPDQTTSVRLDAFKQAFSDVIVKVSGSDEALKNSGLARPLKSSSRYVLQFHYQLRKSDIADSADSTDQASANGQLFLLVSFNPDAVENLLRNNNISIWGNQRPSTLLLISAAPNGAAQLVSDDSTPELVTALEKQARKRGLPVLFPLMDLEDRQQFSVQDVLQKNLQNLSVAAARYAPDALLVGRLSGSDDSKWQGAWQAQFSGKRFDWTFTAARRDSVIDQAMTHLARLLASEYALLSGNGVEQDVLLNVDQVATLQDHVRVLAYLQSLDVVASARLVLIDGARASYRLKLRNSSDDLSRLIGLSSVLEQIDLPQIDASSGDQTIHMNYRLLR